jgi:hypothetical protein
VASASPHETRLVEATLDNHFAPQLPPKLLGDLAYDSDPLDEKLKEKYGVDRIAPHKSNRRKTDELYDAFVAVGKWNGSLPGCTIFAVW